MNNKSFLKQCICAIIFLSIFSGCASNSNQVQEMEECIMLAHSKVSNMEEDDSYSNSNIDNLFTPETILIKLRSLIQDGCKLDSITYIGHNWFKVSYDLTNWYNTECGDEDGLASLYWKVKKIRNSFRLDDVAYAYSQCTSYTEDLPSADKLKFWFKTIKYDDVQPYFQGNLCKVRNDDKYGFINVEGVEILPCEYDDVAFVMGDIMQIDEQEIVYDDSMDNFLYVKLDNKFGVIRFDGTEIIPCKYQDLTLFTENRYLFKAKLDYYYGLIAFDGTEILPCKYSDLTKFGYAIKSRLKGKYGLISFEGKEIIPCKYDDFTIIEEYDFDLIISKSKSKYGLIGIKSEQIESEAFTIVEGSEILPCIFDKLETDDSGMLKVQRDNLWSYYTIDGTQETEFYEDIKYYYELDNPMFAAKSNGKWGYLNKAGDTIVSFVLDYAGKAYNDGTAFVEYEGEYGTLDLNTLFFSPSYDYSSGNSVKKQTCAVCGGTGQMSVRGGGIVLGTQQCPACGGLGYHGVPSY